MTGVFIVTARHRHRLYSAAWLVCADLSWTAAKKLAREFGERLPHLDVRVESAPEVLH